MTFLSVELPLYLYLLVIGDDILGMVEVDLESEVLLLVEEVAHTGNCIGGWSWVWRKTIVPAWPVMGPHVYQFIIISERSLLYMYGRAGIPFGVVAPAKIKTSILYKRPITLILGM